MTLKNDAMYKVRQILGKSTVIHEMVRRIINIFGNDSVKIAAFTGAAAINVDGNTLYTLLRTTVNSKAFELFKGQAAQNF